MSTTREQEVPYQEIVRVLRRHERSILLATIAGIVLAAVGVWLTGPKYEAASTLMLTAQRTPLAVSPDSAPKPIVVDRITEEEINSEVALLSGESILRDVLSDVGDEPGRASPSRVTAWLTFPLRAPGTFAQFLYGTPPPSSLDERVRRTSRHLQVVALKKSNLIRVQYSAADPTWAANFVNKLVTRHIERHSRLSEQSDAQGFFENQRQLLAMQLNDAEAAQLAFYEQAGWDVMPERRAAMQVRLGELETALGNAEVELAASDGRAGFLDRTIANLPQVVTLESRVTQNLAMQFMKPRLFELEMRRSEMLYGYAPTSSKVNDINRQLAEAKKRLGVEKEMVTEVTSGRSKAYEAVDIDRAQAGAEQASVTARRAALQDHVDRARARMEEVEHLAARQHVLEQEVVSAREAFAVYAKKEEEARLSRALDESQFVNIAVAEPADVPTTVDLDMGLLLLVLGALLGLGGGVAFAFVRDRLDPSVKTPAEAHDVSDLPVVARLST